MELCVYKALHSPPSTLMGLPVAGSGLLVAAAISNQNCRRHSISLRTSFVVSY